MLQFYWSIGFLEEFSPLSRHPTLGDLDLNKLETTLPEDVSI